MKYATYKKTKHGITKDGHTMFEQDIISDLNRKSYLEQQLQQYKSLVKTVDAGNLPDGRILLNDNGFVSLGFLDFNKVTNEVRISYSNMTSFIVDEGAHYIEQKDLIKMISGDL